MGCLQRVRSLFKTRAVSKVTLVMWFNWATVTLGYYGISLGIGRLGSDVFLNLALVGALVNCAL